jgi:alkylation response protein AidB-like acyl-CoA dehydrogenase
MVAAAASVALMLNDSSVSCSPGGKGPAESYSLRWVDFDLPPELEDLRASVRRLVADKVAPRSREIDRSGEYPEDLFEAFRDAGLLGLCIPEDFGGSGAGILGLSVAIEEVAKVSNTAALMLLLTRLPTGPLMIAGSEDQKRRYLPGIASGSERAAFGLSEPQAGSDVMGMRTRAVPDPDLDGGWVLSGTKCWMSGVREADWYTVFAKTSDPDSRAHDSVTAFVVERSWEGVSVGRTDHKMGVRGVDTGELLLQDVHVPPGNVIGEVGGFRLAMLGLNSMRPVVAARGIGLAEGALMYATQYVSQRAAFGRTIADFQGIQWEIAKCAVDVEAARLLTYRAAWLADQGKFTKEWVPFLSMAKYHATELAVRASGLALQLLGAAGYMEDHPTEQWYRDAKQLTIVEGTSQVQLGLIARGVLDRDLWWG